jgi:hypothetical protein
MEGQSSWEFVVEVQGSPHEKGLWEKEVVEESEEEGKGSEQGDHLGLKQFEGLGKSGEMIV